MFLTVIIELQVETNMCKPGRGKVAIGRNSWPYVNPMRLPVDNIPGLIRVYRQCTRSSKVRCRIKVVVPQYSIVGGGRKIDLKKQ